MLCIQLNSAEFQKKRERKCLVRFQKCPAISNGENVNRIIYLFLPITFPCVPCIWMGFKKLPQMVYKKETDMKTTRKKNHNAYRFEHLLLNNLRWFSYIYQIYDEINIRRESCWNSRLLFVDGDDDEGDDGNDISGQWNQIHFKFFCKSGATATSLIPRTATPHRARKKNHTNTSSTALLLKKLLDRTLI